MMKEINYKNYIVELFKKKIDIEGLPNVCEAKLIRVKGKGSLKHNFHTLESKTAPYYVDYNDITLNNKILFRQVESPCPTCANTIATGFGIDKNDMIRKIFENILIRYD